MTLAVPDGAGLQGKVAIVTGGGAAGDGIATAARPRSCGGRPRRGSCRGRAGAKRKLEMMRRRAGMVWLRGRRTQARLRAMVAAAEHVRPPHLLTPTSHRSRVTSWRDRGELRRVMQVNVDSLSSRKQPFPMRRAGGGAIVNGSSISALGGWRTAYSSPGRGIALTKAWRGHAARGSRTRGAGPVTRRWCPRAG